jgi:plasmid stabilization system protein ParE
MRFEYSKRAIADLRQIAAYHLRSGNPAVAERIAARIQAVVARIAEIPLSGRPVVQRPGVRVVLPLQNLLQGDGGHDPDHPHPPHLPPAI